MQKTYVMIVIWPYSFQSTRSFWDFFLFKNTDSTYFKNLFGFVWCDDFFWLRKIKPSTSLKVKWLIPSYNKAQNILHVQGSQYFSSLPVLHYLLAVLFLKIRKKNHEYLMQHSLKLGSINYHCKCVKVPGTCLIENMYCIQDMKDEKKIMIVIWPCSQQEYFSEIFI